MYQTQNHRLQIACDGLDRCARINPPQPIAPLGGLRRHRTISLTHPPVKLQTFAIHAIHHAAIVRSP
jgi:hypothetical protein